MEEYLFGLPPKMADARRPLCIEVIEGRLQVTWTQLRNAPDAAFSAERADTIAGPWFGGPGLFEQTERPLANGMLADITLRETVPPSPNGNQRFIRLQVSVR